jgi:tetratricopeptide (TPR) repeat protein
MCSICVASIDAGGVAWPRRIVMRLTCAWHAEHMREMAQGTFGKALGALIRRKRRAVGLTQLQLAEDAFSDHAKVRRISDLENGLVGNPHPKTIDPIIATLKITPEEVEECAREEGAQTDPHLDRAYREARNLIDALAYQFEHAQPSASLAELDDFLRAKAKEWQQLRLRLDSIEAADEEIVARKRQATAALADAQFDKVDEILAELEERFQQQRTLTEVGKQVEIRVTRGDACLMNEDPDTALAHYLQAARFFQPFSEEEMARVLDENAHKVYESSLRTLRPRFSVGVRLLEELLTLGFIVSDVKRRAKAQYQLGLIYRNAAANADGDVEALLAHALDHSRLAEELVGSDNDPFQAVSTKINLANCLLDRGQLLREPAAFKEAIEILRTAKVIALEEEDARPLLGHVCNSLGATLLRARQTSKNGLSRSATAEALEQFSEAISNAERYCFPDVWGSAKMNRARLLEYQAHQAGKSGVERIFRRVQAISEYQAALESYPETLFPDMFAEAHFELAGVLFNHAQAIGDGRDEFYMIRAIQSYEVASTIFAEKPNPLRWAECQMYIGSIFGRHARLEHARDPKHDLEEARQRFQAAYEAFHASGDKKRAAHCEKAVAQAKDELSQRSDSG